MFHSLMARWVIETHLDEEEGLPHNKQINRAGSSTKMLSPILSFFSVLILQREPHLKTKCNESVSSENVVFCVNILILFLQFIKKYCKFFYGIVILTSIPVKHQF